MKCPNGRETNILSPNVREGRRASLCAMCSCRREKLHGLTAEAGSAPSEIEIMKTRKTVAYVTKQEAECAEGFSSCQLASTCGSMHPRWSTSDGHISIKDWKDCPIGIGCPLKNHQKSVVQRSWIQFSGRLWYLCALRHVKKLNFLQSHTKPPCCATLTSTLVAQ